MSLSALNPKQRASWKWSGDDVAVCEVGQIEKEYADFWKAYVRWPDGVLHRVGYLYGSSGSAKSAVVRHWKWFVLPKVQRANAVESKPVENSEESAKNSEQGKAQ
jgi:hypothetical protein